MAGNEDQPRLLCIWARSTPEGLVTALAFIDSIGQNLQLSEISDSADFLSCQSILMALSPAKVLCWTTFELKSIEEQCCELGIAFEVLGTMPSSKSSARLRDFLRAEYEYTTEKWESAVSGAVKVALQGLAAICAFPAHQYTVETIASTPYMTIDLNAIKALDLFGRKSTSLFSLLNHTSSPLGLSTLRKWLSQPLKSLPQIHQRQTIVGELMEKRALSQRLAVKLKQVPDLNQLFLRFTRKLGSSSASLSDCVKLYHFARLLQGVDQLLTEGEVGSLRQFTAGIQEASCAFVNLIELVERGIDLKSYEKDWEYHVNPDFNEDLRALKEEVSHIEAQVEALAVTVQKGLRLSCGSIKITTSASQGFLFEANKGDLDAALKTGSEDMGVKVVTHKMHRTSFTVTKLVSLSALKQSKLTAMSTIQAGLAEKVISLVASYAQLIPKTAEIVGELDTLLSFAAFCLASPKPFVRCEIVPEGDIVLYGNRHPGLERISADCRANDVYLSRRSGFLQVITGPNMGGKTTYLRQVALSVILNQIGCFVPCSPGPNSLPLIDSVLSRVGAGDQSQSGLSTYMVEMVDVASLLRAVTPASLVIIDELGRGTSTSDGIGFSVAVIEHLAREMKCFTLIATHFAELTTLSIPGVAFKRMAAEVRKGNLTFLYAVIDGAADSSYGIEVAAQLGYSEEDIQAALEFRREMEAEIDGEMKELYHCLVNRGGEQAEKALMETLRSLE